MDLYRAEQFEPLTDTPWDPSRVEDAIAAIVRNTDKAFDEGSLWPADGWDAGDTPLPLSGLYVGASGVIWGLDALRRSGHAESSLDLKAVALRTLELCRMEPDIEPGEEHYHQSSLFFGETGPLLVAFRLAPDRTLADDLERLLPTSAEQLTDDINWGVPGAILAVMALHEWTGEERWLEMARNLASILKSRRGHDGLWRQDDDYRGLGALHGVAGNTLALLRVEPDATLAQATAAVLARYAVREDGFANWPGAKDRSLVRPRDGCICLQWCTGAPGILAGACDFLDEELMHLGANLIWQAGAHGDDKGHGLCHGTSGNGFALLKMFSRTGDEHWLARARRFAVHALEQAEKTTAANGGRGHHSLFTGDVGAALFAAACLDGDTHFPIIDVL